MFTTLVCGAKIGAVETRAGRSTVRARRVSCKMERRNGQIQLVSFELLPSICEYREFGSEEDYQRTVTNSKLYKTRYASPTLTHQRFGDDKKERDEEEEEEEEEEEQRPLLSLHTEHQDSKREMLEEKYWQPKRKPKHYTEGRVGVQKRRSSSNKVRDREEWKVAKPLKQNKLAKGRIMQRDRGAGNVPKVSRGWKMHKKRVKIAWAKSRGCRQTLRSSLKLVLSDCPLFLVKALRDAYVSVMTSMASRCNQRMWYLAGARLL